MVVEAKKAHLSGAVKSEGDSHYAQATEELWAPGTRWTLQD